MTPETMVQITPRTSERIRLLRQGRRWSVELAAAKSGVPVAVWAAGETGGPIRQDQYAAILALLGLTEQVVAFIERTAPRSQR